MGSNYKHEKKKVEYKIKVTDKVPVKKPDAYAVVKTNN